jgi:hypothetical protein
MRKIVAFATILGFVATTSMGLAVTQKGSQEALTVSGKVSAIQNGGEAEMNHQTKQVAAATAPTEITGTVTSIKGRRLKVKDEKGKTHSIKADSSKELQGIKVGDSVNVKLEKGKVVSIEKSEATMPSATPEAE